MTTRIINSNFANRVFYGFIPLLSWLFITLPLWLSPFHPAIVAYFIIAFDLYFLYKAITTAYYATLSYKKILINLKVRYDKKILKNRKSKDIKHFIVIPNYKEPIHKLDSTIASLIKSDYPYKNIFLVLAFEKRESEAITKAEVIKNKYGSNFTEILVYFHKIEENEIPGKASNQAYAAKQIESYVTQKMWSKEDTLITICDADSNLDKNYLSYLTYEFVKDKNRLYHFYWAPVLLYNNFWQLPFIVRIQTTVSSILRLAFLSQKDRLIQISTYSTNLWLLEKINYWDTDIIPEDWHVYFQAYFTIGEKVATIPLYTLVNGDAVYSGGLFKTLKNRYEQEKRWAWGVSDIGYTLKKFFTTPKLNPINKLKRIWYLGETHLLWTTSFFILTVSASVPPLINPLFKRTVLGFILPRLSGLILTLSSLMLVLYIYLDYKLRQKVNQKTTLLALPFLFIQWYLLPIVSFFFSSLPALEAHTRLLLGKKITYKVTEKV